MTTAQTGFKYPEEAKMPADYDFSTKGMDWNKFKGNYTLRTDAVWEKYKLKDFFRLFYKCFYFNPETNSYQMIEPEDIYTMIYEAYSLEDSMTEYQGYSPTGRTTSFQIGQSPKDMAKVSAQNHFLHRDFFELLYRCAMRFERWNRCDLKYGDMKIPFLNKKRPRDGDSDEYPCFREYFESQYACSDDMFDFLIELHYSKKINDLWEEDYWNIEMRRLPTYFDSPHHETEHNYTY